MVKILIAHKHVLVAEYVIVDIVLLRRLSSKHKGLSEPSHGLPTIRELTSHLEERQYYSSHLRKHNLKAMK